MNHQEPLEPIDSVLDCAASMTQARDILNDRADPKYYPRLSTGMVNSIAAGKVAYALLYLEIARDDLRDAGHEFGNMVVDSAKGDLARAHNVLRANAVDHDACVFADAAGHVADGHRKLEKFHRALGFRAITDDDIGGRNPGVGGGGGR